MICHFIGCTALEKVNFKGNTDIGYGTFGKCESLKQVNLSSKGTVGTRAFQECINLTYIKIPSGVNLTGESVFDDIPNIIVEEGYLNASSTWNRDWNKTYNGIVTLKPGK